MTERNIEALRAALARSEDGSQKERRATTFERFVPPQLGGSVASPVSGFSLVDGPNLSVPSRVRCAPMQAMLAIRRSTTTVSEPAVVTQSSTSSPIHIGERAKPQRLKPLIAGAELSRSELDAAFGHSHNTPSAASPKQSATPLPMGSATFRSPSPRARRNLDLDATSDGSHDTSSDSGADSDAEDRSHLLHEVAAIPGLQPLLLSLGYLRRAKEKVQQNADSTTVRANSEQFHDPLDERCFLAAMKAHQLRRVVQLYRAGGGSMAGRLASPFGHQPTDADRTPLLSLDQLLRSFTHEDDSRRRFRRSLERFGGLLQVLRSAWGIHDDADSAPEEYWVRRRRKRGSGIDGNLSDATVDPRLKKYDSKVRLPPKKSSGDVASERAQLEYYSVGATDTAAVEAQVRDAAEKVAKETEAVRHAVAASLEREREKHRKHHGRARGFLPSTDHSDVNGPASPTRRDEMTNGLASAVTTLPPIHTTQRVERRPGESLHPSAKVTIEREGASGHKKETESAASQRPLVTNAIPAVDEKDNLRGVHAEVAEKSSVEAGEEYVRPLFFREKFVAPRRAAKDPARSQRSPPPSTSAATAVEADATQNVVSRAAEPPAKVEDAQHPVVSLPVTVADTVPSLPNAAMTATADPEVAADAPSKRAAERRAHRQKVDTRVAQPISRRMNAAPSQPSPPETTTPSTCPPLDVSAAPAAEATISQGPPHNSPARGAAGKPKNRETAAAAAPVVAAHSPAPLTRTQKLEALKRLQEQQQKQAIDSGDSNLSLMGSEGQRGATGSVRAKAHPLGGKAETNPSPLLTVVTQKGHVPDAGAGGGSVNANAASPGAAGTTSRQPRPAATSPTPAKRKPVGPTDASVERPSVKLPTSPPARSASPESPASPATSTSSPLGTTLRDRARSKAAVNTVCVDSLHDLSATIPTEEVIDDEASQFAGLTAGDVLCHSRLAKWCPPLTEVESRLKAARANVAEWAPPAKGAKHTATKLTAVVAAISEYSDSKIEPLGRGAVCDAHAVAMFLGGLGYQVTTLFGEDFSSLPTKDNVLNAVKHAVATCGIPPDPDNHKAFGAGAGRDAEKPNKSDDERSPTGVCFVYIAGRGVLGALHGFEGDVFYMPHVDTRLSAMSRHNTIVLSEITAIRNTTTFVQPIVMAEIHPMNVAIRGVPKANVGERYAVVQCGRRSYGSDMTLRYPRRAGGNAFTWYLLKGLQGDAIRSGHVTPALLNAFVKESVEKSFDKMLQEQLKASQQIAAATKGGDVDDGGESSTQQATAVATEASKWMSSKQSRTVEQELVSKDTQMFQFKKELQARKAMTSQTTCCFCIEALVDVSYLNNVPAFQRNLLAKMVQVFYPKGKPYSSRRGGLRLVAFLRTGEYRLQLDPELVGGNLGLVISNGSCDDDVARLVFGSGTSLRAAAGPAEHTSPAVAEQLAREHRERLERLEYRLVTSASQMEISTAGTRNPSQRDLFDRIFQSYYKENVRKVGGFSIHRGQERVNIVFEGCDRDFLEAVKHGALGTFCVKPLHFITTLHVEYQQLAPTEAMVQQFNENSARTLASLQQQLRQRVAEFEAGPDFAKFVLQLHKSPGGVGAPGSPLHVPNTPGALSKKIGSLFIIAQGESSEAAGSGTEQHPAAAALRRTRSTAAVLSAPPDAFIPPGLPADIQLLLRRALRQQAEHFACIKPRLGVVPPSRLSRRIFDAVVRLQARVRGWATRVRLGPLLACLRDAMSEKAAIFLVDGVDALREMKEAIETAERRRVLEEKESQTRAQTIQVHGEIFAEFIGMHLRYVPREELLLRKRDILHVEQRERLFFEEDFDRRQYFAIAISFTRLLLGAVAMQHLETEKRLRMENIEVSDRQKIKTFAQNSYLQILQRQQQRR